MNDHVVLLRTNHRSEPRIREAAQAINAQDATIVERLPRVTALDTLEAQGGCWLLEQVSQTSNEVRGITQKWADYANLHSRHNGMTLSALVHDLVSDDAITKPELARDLFAALDRFRLLTLVRDGAWGCVEINRTMEEYLRPRLDPRTRGRLFAGAPVLITRNDAARGLFNGDVGITLRNRRGGLDVLFQRQSGCLAFPAEALPAHELGFALTIHKSQGSEYANVMVVLPPSGGRRLLTKELIYTAITRAKSLSVICSARDVLKLAISRRIVRESGVFR
jgi:exodeoxyribonuclease V alpha subunit